MTGSCNRLWARVVLKPKSESDKSSSKQTAEDQDCRCQTWER